MTLDIAAVYSSNSARCEGVRKDRDRRQVSFNSSLTNNPVKTKTPTINVSPRFSLRLAPTLVVAAVFILSVAAQFTYAMPGDLYESDSNSGNIYEFTPGGTRSTFASGLDRPNFLAFEPVPEGSTLGLLAVGALGPQPNDFFRFQIALTLTIEKHKLPSRTIPLRYNFPNDPGFEQKYPNDLSDVRILHYLRCEVVHRERDFVDLTRVAALIQRRDLRGSNEVLRRCAEERYPAIKREEDRLGVRESKYVEVTSR
jgi:hypothetical protein